MGAVHDAEEDARARDLMRDIPNEVRAWICHHFGNSLCAVVGGVHHLVLEMEAGRITLPERSALLVRNVHTAAQHMADDLMVIRTSNGQENDREVTRW
jgi:hypothetical protein